MTSDPTDLANLRDLALPPPVPWWPPTLGWWLLAGGIVCLGLVRLVRLMLHYQQNAYRRAALRELLVLERKPPVDFAAAVAAVLKRTALAAYSRETVAGLTGSSWTMFLVCSGRFPCRTASLLTQAVVDPSYRLGTDEVRDILAASRSWIRHHVTPRSAS